jgi:probable lipoprotein NlpC
MWSDGFIGVPYAEFGRDRAGCDCWGLACVIYREELGITLPDYLGYGSVDEHGEIAALIDGAAETPLWLPVSGPALAFDIAVFRRGRLSTHVGIVVRHGVMIHMAAEDCAKLADYRAGAWGNRFKGHWRHHSRAIERPVQLISEARR